MEIRQLKYFLKIDELKSFTAAANSLGLSQSALSLSIKELENALGSQVFLRGPSGIQLTEVGKKVKGYATSILQQHAKALCDVSAIKGAQNRSIQLGINAAFPRKFLDDLLELFYQRAPGVSVHLSYAAQPLQTIITNIDQNSWDAAMTLDADGSLEQANPTLKCESIASSKYHIYARADHEIHHYGRIQLQHLLKANWAQSTTVDTLTMARDLVNEGNERELSVALYADSIDLILAAASRMDLLCFAPEKLVEASGLPLKIVEQSFMAVPAAHWKLLYSSDLHLSEPTKMFIKCVRQICDQRLKTGKI